MPAVLSAATGHPPANTCRKASAIASKVFGAASFPERAPLQPFRRGAGSVRRRRPAPRQRRPQQPRVEQQLQHATLAEPLPQGGPAGRSAAATAASSTAAACVAAVVFRAWRQRRRQRGEDRAAELPLKQLQRGRAGHVTACRQEW